MKNLVFVVVAFSCVGVLGYLMTRPEVEEAPPVTHRVPTVDDPRMSAPTLTEIDGSEEKKVEPPVPSRTGPWPKADATSTEHHFGRMQLGAELEHTFVIENNGEADLELVSGKPSCKCTAFELSKTVVKPKETAELLVRWEGKVVDERFRHGGPIYTNDPKRKSLRFSVQGAVDNAIKIVPEDVWNIPGVTRTRDGETQGVIGSRVFGKFEIKELECKSPHIKLSFEPLPEKTLAEYELISGYSVKVKALSDIPPGLFQDSIKVSLDCIENPLQIRISATKVGPIKVLSAKGGVWVPSSRGLKLGQFSAKKGREATMTLLVEKDGMTEPFRITSVESSPGFLKAELEAAGSASPEVDRYLLKIKVPSGIPRVKRESGNPATISLQTNHPSEPDFRMKLSFKAF